MDSDTTLRLATTFIGVRASNNFCRNKINFILFRVESQPAQFKNNVALAASDIFHFTACLNICHCVAKRRIFIKGSRFIGII